MRAMSAEAKSWFEAEPCARPFSGERGGSRPTSGRTHPGWALRARVWAKSELGQIRPNQPQRQSNQVWFSSQPWAPVFGRLFHRQFARTPPSFAPQSRFSDLAPCGSRTTSPLASTASHDVALALTVLSRADSGDPLRAVSRAPVGSAPFCRARPELGRTQPKLSRSRSEIGCPHKSPFLRLPCWRWSSGSTAFVVRPTLGRFRLTLVCLRSIWVGVQGPVALRNGSPRKGHGGHLSGRHSATIQRSLWYFGPRRPPDLFPKQDVGQLQRTM